MSEPDDGFSEMTMEEDLHKLKFTKKGRSKESIFEHLQDYHAIQAHVSQFKESGTHFET